MNLIRMTAISTPKTFFLLPRCTILTQQLSTTANYTSRKATPSTWPRPTAIPYQPKLSNSANLFGRIQIPIHFHSTPDGKNIAATFIAQKHGAFIANSSASLLIPVLFEGDLAHVVASHVKQNDCVYVSGKLSLNPLPFVLSENQGKFHLVGNDINFVEGLDMQVCSTLIDNAVKEQVGRNDIHDGSNLIIQEDNEKHNVVEEQVGKLHSSTPVPVWVDKRLNELNLENKIEVLNIEKKRAAGSVATFGSWRDLVKNPMNWRDYREKKSIGLVKAKHPDFKHTTNGTSLWLDTAPEWVVAGLAGLNVGGKGKKEDSWKEDSWKDLVQNPDNWWDNRSSKINVKSPDFKHKETGEGLWLNSKPYWVSSQLPSSKHEHYVADLDKNTYAT